ncbi:hypothetical protein C1H46_010416 [Malus baccata]|uniref:Uncharacterized protein n=1 Tax=Malus baccata TaxID=106549 RepID=A0A540MZ13_MALBA|nr:hypothetical protein C1H46_010416 [Malus baccata]
MSVGSQSTDVKSRNWPLRCSDQCRVKRFNEFGVHGGPAAKDLAPKFNVFKKNLSAKLGVTIPEIDVPQSEHTWSSD